MSGHRTVRAAFAVVLLAGSVGALAPALAQAPPGHRLPPPDPSGALPMTAPSVPDSVRVQCSRSVVASSKQARAPP